MARAARRSGFTLRAKWTLAIVVVTVAPMIVLALVVLDIQRRGLERAEKELEAAVVDEAAESVLATLDEAGSVAKRVAAVFADETLPVDARMRLIGEIVAKAPATSGVAFFDEDRRFVDAIVKGADIDRSPPTGTEGLHGLRWEAPLSGGVRGFVVVAIAKDALAARLRDLSVVRFGAPDRVHLVDEAHDVLGGSDHGALSFFEASGAAARGFSSEMLVTTELDDHGVHEVGTIRTMPAQRLALVVERPADEAFAALASARRAVVLGVAAIAALAALVGALVARRVLGPIGALMRLVDRYGKREFSARSDVETGDELEELGSSLERMADDLATSEHEIERRARIEANLRRYMPEEAAEAAAKGDGASLDLGGARRRVTVVFADVVAFTGFVERTPPERAVAFLNELFTMLSEIVFRHGGMVDKFMGDCVMAVFRDDVARALAAAEDMHAFVASNLPRWREEYAFAVELGIGVATGEVLVGNLGSETRMEYTVIGDAVNVAARLEALARPRQTLTTREVADACPDVAFASLGAHALRGKAHPVEVLEVVS